MTDNTNVVPIPEPLNKLAAEIRFAYEQRDQGRDEWIRGTLSLAVKLREARRRFGNDDVAFGCWLEQNRINKLGENNRAALIAMATEPERLREVLIEQEHEWEPDTIWRKVRHTFGKFPKEEIEPPIVQIPVQSAPEAHSLFSEPAKNPVTSAPELPSPRSLGNKHSFRGRRRGEQVAAIYQNRAIHCRIAAAADKKSKIWDLILQAIDAGFVTVNNVCPSEINLGVLFPNAPSRFRASRVLTNKDDLKVIETQIMPAAMANRAAILANPDNIEHIIHGHANQLRQAAAAEQRAREIEAAKATMKAGEHQVIVFGKTFWPIYDWDPELAYDFETLRVAVWTFRELHMMAKSASDSAPRSAALHIRYSIKFLWRSADKQMRKILLLITDLTRALEANPHGHLDPGERLPTMPVTDRGDD